MIATPQPFDELALPGQIGLVRGQLGGADVHAQELAPGAHGDASRPADGVVTARLTREAHHHPLLRLPRAVDAVATAVLAHDLVDAVGGPRQRQLPQRGQIPGPEEGGQAGVDGFGGDDLPGSQPVTEHLVGEVDQMDLVGRLEDLIGDRLGGGGAGDLFHHVPERLQLEDAHRADHINPGFEQFLDVLPASRVDGARSVAMGDVVDERHPGGSLQQGLDLHGEAGALRRLRRPVGEHLQPGEQGLRLGAPPGLGQTHHRVHPALGEVMDLLQGGVGLAHPGDGPHVHPQPASSHPGPPASRRTRPAPARGRRSGP